MIDETIKKHTRAEMYRDMVTVDIAKDSEGFDIAEILIANNSMVADHDWTKVYPHWLVAKVGEEIVGCVMLLPAKPFGFMEFLYVHPDVKTKIKAIALHKLCYQGAGTLQMFGSSSCCGMINAKNTIFQGIAKKHGMVKIADAEVFGKRLK